FFSSRRRHTRFSRDWSSDVCSSDLNPSVERAGQSALARRQTPRVFAQGSRASALVIAGGESGAAPERTSAGTGGTERGVAERLRSEERRVGKECRCGGWRDQGKKKR